MIRKTFIIIALLGLVSMLVPACGGSSDSVLGIRPVGTIFGRVVDTVTDTPLLGATVTITSKPLPTDTTETGNVVMTATTDAEGTFNRGDIPTGQVVIAVKRNGYRTPPTQLWALAPGGSGEFYFEMAPGEDPYQAPETDNQRARPGDSKWDEL
ncbi:MAG: carboxypeptidase regulatory-like domain-containing protein [bacterium]|nr:carboxypeptidase regulatory-like domain-containing protein [bacterium]